MRTKLAVFGDSFIYGHGLQDRQTESLPAHLGRQLGLEVENYGEPGASLIDTVVQFRNWINQTSDPKSYVVIAGLTESVRETIYLPYGNRSRPISEYVNDTTNFFNKYRDSPEIISFARLFVDKVDIKFYGELKYWMTCSLFSHWSQNLGAGCLLFNIWPPEFEYIAVKEISSVKDLLSWEHDDQDRQHKLPCGHINSHGLELYSRLLTEDIKQRKLLEC